MKTETMNKTPLVVLVTTEFVALAYKLKAWWNDYPSRRWDIVWTESPKDIRRMKRFLKWKPTRRGPTPREERWDREEFEATKSGFILIGPQNPDILRLVRLLERKELVDLSEVFFGMHPPEMWLTYHVKYSKDRGRKALGQLYELLEVLQYR